MKRLMRNIVLAIVLNFGMHVEATESKVVDALNVVIESSGFLSERDVVNLRSVNHALCDGLLRTHQVFLLSSFHKAPSLIEKMKILNNYLEKRERITEGKGNIIFTPDFFENLALSFLNLDLEKENRFGSYGVAILRRLSLYNMVKLSDQDEETYNKFDRICTNIRDCIVFCKNVYSIVIPDFLTCRPVFVQDAHLYTTIISYFEKLKIKLEEKIEIFEDIRRRIWLKKILIPITFAPFSSAPSIVDPQALGSSLPESADEEL
jgi:hypothetical protein